VVYEINSSVNKGNGVRWAIRDNIFLKWGVETGNQSWQMVSEVVGNMMGYLSWAKEREALINHDIIYVLLVMANMIEAALSGVNIDILEIHTSGNEHRRGMRSEEMSRLGLVQIANAWRGALPWDSHVQVNHWALLPIILYYNIKQRILKPMQE
jgi:hypothetical protein